MNVLILMGSPRRVSNTAELCKPFMDELQKLGASMRYVTLADKHIQPCLGCYACQQVSGEYGCVQHDDMLSIVAHIQWADLIVLATPIYAWYCAAPMKNVLDRHYGLNKYYGSGKGSLWAGKQVAIIATHGYDGAYATDPFEMGVQRLCKHSNLTYVGMYSVQDEDDLASFQSETAQTGAREFARNLYSLHSKNDAFKGERMKIETERLIITEFTMDMAEAVHLNSLDDDTRRFVPDEVFETVEEAADTVGFLMGVYENGDGPLVYPTLLKDGTYIGYVQAVPLDDGNWEVGYHIGAAYTQKGYATEAVKAFLPIIMPKLGISTIAGICRCANAASIKVLQRCGFFKEFEGLGNYQGEEQPICKYIYSL